MAKKTKKLHPGGFAQNDFMAGVRRQQRGQKNRGKVDSQQQRTPNQLTRQQHRAIKNAQKFLKQNYRKILKLQDVGKHQTAVNTTQLVLVVQSQDVVQIY